MLTLPHRTIWTDAAISLFSTWQAILIRTYLATDCWWTHSFVLLVFLKCYDVLDGDTIIVRTALCLIMTNDNIQVDVCSIYCLIATIHVAAVVNDAVVVMVCAHQAHYRVWPTWISTNSPHRHVHVFCCGLSQIKQMSCACLYLCIPQCCQVRY